MAFSDVTPEDPFYGYIEYMFCRGVISGYADGTFKPTNAVNRGALAKMITLSFNFPINTTGGPHFSDVDPATNPFYQPIETLYNMGIISGYADGTFRPFSIINRSQITKIVVNAAIARDPTNWALINPATPSFADIPPANPFYTFIETGYAHGVVGGYPCGGVGEPCPGLYFRPVVNMTRAQVAKMLYQTLTWPSAPDHSTP
jgi:hypothetical protein